jgi:acetylglutamate kinase
MHKKVQTAKTLLDALPYIKEFNGQKMVIKYGGAAQINPQLKELFARDILLLTLVGIKPIIVHGGGKDINVLLAKLGIEPKFVDGLRVTDEATMEVVEMSLFGSINNEIVSLLGHHGVKAMGLNGKSANFVIGEPYMDGKLGLTGEPKSVDASILERLLDEKFVPVIAPIAGGESANHPGYNINADTMASAVAKAVGAKKVIFMTDTMGVLDEAKTLLSSLDKETIEKLKKSGVINGGMIPKVDACIDAVDGGVEKAHIIDGRVEHALLLELFTESGVGTQITK